MSRTILIMPLIGLVIICLFFLIFILLEKNPNDPPSALLNKNLPTFSSINLYDKEEVLLCVGCVVLFESLFECGNECWACMEV